MIADNRVDLVNEFFNNDFKWWEDVYDNNLPKGFFSYEMIKRKEILLQMLAGIVGEHPHAAILECGCGPGGILSEITPSGNLLAGVDINYNYLARAQSDCHTGNNLLQADITELPFKDNSFDVVYCAGVLGYLEEDRSAIAEMRRVTKPGGTIIIAVQSYFLVNKLFDPYYYFVWGFQVVFRKIRHVLFKRSAPINKYEIKMLRRYSFGQLHPLYREFGLTIKTSAGVSFGPPTFWRKDVLPLPSAIRISEAILRLSHTRGLSILTRFANHWVVSIEKTVAGEFSGR